MDVQKKNADKADFLVIYVSEAHAKDEWFLFTDVCFDQPKCFDERIDLAARLLPRELLAALPVTIDGMDNLAEGLYAAWPERLYIVGGDGKIAYKGGLGPDDYNIPEMAGVLGKLVTDV